MVSGTISLPCLGFFSPFPHGTSSLSVSREYLALRDGPRRFRQDFTCPALLGYAIRRYVKVSVTGLSPSVVRHSRRFTYRDFSSGSSPLRPATPDGLASIRFGLFRVRSPLLTESLLAFFSYGY